MQLAPQTFLFPRLRVFYRYRHRDDKLRQTAFPGMGIEPAKVLIAGVGHI